MSTRRPITWASVVATGIIEEPLPLPDSATPPPSKSTSDGSLAEDKTTTLLSPQKPTEAMTVPEPVVGSQLSATSPVNEAMSVSPADDSNNASNQQSSSQDLGRAFYSVWPSRPKPLEDNQQQYKNSQAGNNRLRRHNSENMRSHEFFGKPRGSKTMIQQPKLPWDQTGMYYPIPESNENDSGSQTSQYEPANYGYYDSSGQLVLNDAMMQPQTYRPYEMSGRRTCVSPRARDRCQVPLSSAEYDKFEWQSIGESVQVWEPLDSNQLFKDPSNAFLHVSRSPYSRCGKASLSTRARQLMGEQVKGSSHTDYPTPTPMTMPELQLREHLCFIANYDTHLTKSKAQLRVTNGTTGDGYYVSHLPKLTPMRKYVGPPGEALVDDPARSSSSPPAPKVPEYRGFRPSVSYWELVRQNQETDQDSPVDLSQDYGTAYFNGNVNDNGPTDTNNN